MLTPAPVASAAAPSTWRSFSVRSSPRRLAAACLLSLFVALQPPRPHSASRSDCSPDPGWPGQDSASPRPDSALVNRPIAQRRASASCTQSQSLTNAAVWKASAARGRRPAAGAGAFDPQRLRDRSDARGAFQACGYGDCVRREHRPGPTVAPGGDGPWIASAGHRANLEYPYWTAIGVGAVPGQGGYGWVQEFGISNPDPIATPLRACPDAVSMAPARRPDASPPIVAPLPRRGRRGRRRARAS